MIEAWHLSWVLPVTFMLGFTISAYLVGGEDDPPKETPPEDNAYPDDNLCKDCPFNPRYENDEII